jgi:hypothetical protein
MKFKAKLTVVLLGYTILHLIIPLALIKWVLKNDFSPESIEGLGSPVKIRALIYEGHSKTGDSLAWLNQLKAHYGISEQNGNEYPTFDDGKVHMDIAEVLSINPYPPLLAEREVRLDSYFIQYAMLLMQLHDGRYRQHLVVAGESDTTPSILVPKYRGKKTGWGDYFIRYSFIVEGKGELTPYSANLVDVSWNSIEGGSSNGFEEIGIVFVAILTWFCGLIVIPLLFQILEKRKDQRVAA